MTCDKVFNQILDFAFVNFENSSITPEEAFRCSVIEFFSKGCGKDLSNPYSDFISRCKNSNKYCEDIKI